MPDREHRHIEPVVQSVESSKTGEKIIEQKMGQGLFVDVVVIGSAAEKAGIKMGDQIVSVDGMCPASKEELSYLIQSAGEAPVQFVIARKGIEMNVEVRPVYNNELGRVQAGVVSASKERIRKTDSSKTYDCLRQEIPYVGADGKEVCVAMVDVKEGEITMHSENGTEYPARKLDAFILVNKEGKKYDVLEKFNTHHLPILVDQRVENAHYTEFFEQSEDSSEEKIGSKVLVIGDYRSPLSMAILLHELTHVDQSFQTGDARKLYDLYGSELAVDEYDKKGYAAIRDLVHRIVSVVPEAGADIDNQLKELDAIIGDEDEYGDFHNGKLNRVVGGMKEYFFTEVEKVAKMNSWQDDQWQKFLLRAEDYVNPDLVKDLDDFWPEQADIKEILKKLVDMRVIHEGQAESFLEKMIDWRHQCDVIKDRERKLVDQARILAILALPTQMLERDAERGSLQGLRKIRQESSIDLLAQVLVVPSYVQPNDPLVQEYEDKRAEVESRIMRQSVQSVYDNLAVSLPAGIGSGHIVSDARRRVRRYMRELAATPASMRRLDTDDKLGEMPQWGSVVKRLQKKD
jgi:hypothetical protein